MPEARDLWYIRFPDGKVARAAGVAFIRQQLIAGRVPADAQLRRKSEEHWLPVADHPEFADLREGSGPMGSGSWHDISLNGEAKAAPTVASRMDAAQLRLPGVPPLLDELLAALDSTFVYRKLLLAAVVALPLWVLFVAASLPGLLSPALVPYQPAGVLALAVLGLLFLQAMLTRMTFTEVSRMRPARIRDGYPGLPALWLKCILVQGVAIGLVAAAAWGLRLLPDWLRGLDGEAAWAEGLSWAALCAGAMLQVALWPLLLLLAPFPAVCVAEDASLGQALGHLRRVVGANRWKAFVAQWLILALAGLLVLPVERLLLPRLLDGMGTQGVLVCRAMLAALAACLATAYLSVANVFLWLHLRYEGK